MRFLLYVVPALLLGLPTGHLPAQGILPGDRWPLRGTPRICGRDIPQFVLLQDVSVYLAKQDASFVGPRRLHGIPKNLFVPVSESNEGVFYHAMNGLWERDSYWSIHLVPGGLYVSKTKQNGIFAYVGDARKPGWVLTPMRRPLPMEILEKLRIGRPAGR